MDKKLTGNRCYCTLCNEYFNSVGAFDYHLKSTSRGKGAKKPARHDIKGMQRNDAGFLVIQRWDMPLQSWTTPQEGGSTDPPGPTP